ncbi:MAG: rhamnogalacturonan lyase family protein, partial [Thermoguttaceae bacterium]
MFRVRSRNPLCVWLRFSWSVDAVRAKRSEILMTLTRRNAALLMICWTCVLPSPAHAATGGLRLSGRALVAVPRPEDGVFLTWRHLNQDGPDAGFAVYRAAAGSEQYAKIGEARETTTFLDSPGHGEFSYYVVPDGGELKNERSNVCRVTTQVQGRDWVEILPAARGRKLQFADRHFADTDGDGELQFVTYYPQVTSYRGGVSPESYKLQVYGLFDEEPPRWTYDTGMGLQSKPADGDKRTDWDYEWTFKPVAWDIDGDGRSEIITLAKNADTSGVYKYVALKDLGNRCQVAGTLDSPVPVAPLPNDNNARHFPFFADLGGKSYSFVLQGGTYRYWEMWAYDFNGSGFDLRWHVKSTEPDFTGNRSSSHTVLVVDVDGDGLDEINNGCTMLDHDGSVLWSANECFGSDMHVDGQVIDDIDPTNPGLEVMM